MKKKLIPLILVLVCAIACAFGLAACGGSNKIKISTAKFTDNGIDQINVAGIPNGTSTTEDYDNDKPITRQSGCIYFWDGNPKDDYVAEWDNGKWDACVEVRIRNSHTIGTLKIEVGGKEYELTQPDMFDKAILKGFYGFNADEQDYYVYIEEPISADTQIKIKGHTQAKPYSIEVGIHDNYEEGTYNPEDSLHTDFVFKYAVNDDAMSGELNIYQLKEALETIENLDADDTVTVIGYFKTLGYQFTSAIDAGLFSTFWDYQIKLDGNQVIWTANYNSHDFGFDYPKLNQFFGNNN